MRTLRQARGALSGLGLGLVLLTPLAGCSSLQQVGGPPPIGLSELQRNKLLTATDDFDVSQAMGDANADATRRRELRNAYIANRLVLMDVAFLNYLRTLTTDKHTLDAASEGTVLGLSVLGTLMNATQAKENLAALVATITGLKAVVDKNFFDNRGLDAIASTMVAKRKEVLARILVALPGSAEAYPLVAARNDLNDYYLAGTMDGAFLTIQAEANKRDEAASRNLSQTLMVANTMENLSSTTLASKRSLTLALGAPTATLEAVTAALTALSVPSDQLPAAKDAAVALLQKYVREARTQVQIDALAAIFRNAGLTP